MTSEIMLSYSLSVLLTLAVIWLAYECYQLADILEDILPALEKANEDKQTVYLKVEEP